MTQSPDSSVVSEPPETSVFETHGDDSSARVATRLGDRIIAGATIALGAAVLLLAMDFPEPGQPEDPGTAVLPQLIALALLLLGVMLFFNAESNIIAPEKGSRLRTGLMVVCGLGYTLLIGSIGFVLSTLIFMVLGLLIMGIRSLWRLLVASVVVAMAVHYLFTAVLGVYLPAGLIEGVLP